MSLGRPTSRWEYNLHVGPKDERKLLTVFIVLRISRSGKLLSLSGLVLNADSNTNVPV
jgi:hypothetical protein